MGESIREKYPGVSHLRIHPEITHLRTSQAEINHLGDQSEGSIRLRVQFILKISHQEQKVTHGYLKMLSGHQASGDQAGGQSDMC